MTQSAVEWSGRAMTEEDHKQQDPKASGAEGESDDGTDPTVMRWVLRGGERVMMLRGTAPGSPDRFSSRPKAQALGKATDSLAAQAPMPVVVSDTEVVEILDGEVVVGPRPGPAEARAAMELLGELRVPLGLTDGATAPWIFLKEPELQLGASADQLVPDLAGWRREQLPERPKTTAISVPPEWICEVVSSQTRTHDRSIKMPCYLKHGVRYLWLLDPSAETLEVFRRTDGHWALLSSRSGKELVREEPFETAEVSLERLWAW